MLRVSIVALRRNTSTPRCAARDKYFRRSPGLVAVRSAGRTLSVSFEFSAPDDFAHRVGIFRVVQIAEDNQLCVRIFFEMFVNDSAQNSCLAKTFFGFVCIWNLQLRFQMRGDEREGKICCGLDFYFGKTTADAENVFRQEKFIIRVWMPLALMGQKFAQLGDVDVSCPLATM